MSLPSLWMNDLSETFSLIIQLKGLVK